ncbi:MAG TPA: formylglycine-generating enzyme family protein [Caulobacteraceae bacterium]|jgi:formylglycine-generating enzyme required for sulfatase activity|nr:formylglycine-generating enzyme family protein [Caulobacteraceae bacterium]
MGLASTAGADVLGRYGAWAKAHPNAEAEIADLKAKTAALVQARLSQPTPPEAPQPPQIWRVDGAIGEIVDCADCPDMVVIPAGRFTMGSPLSEPNRISTEVQYGVTIAYPFAVGRFDVTFDEWNACVRDGGCGGYKPDDRGWGRGKRPVINVSWDDAQAYVAWLSRKAGHVYRLLSQTEWEYAARAGTTTPFFFGDAISPSLANHDGSYGYPNNTPVGGLRRGKTTPVGAFKPNGFGLYDMAGNVWQWTQDCWADYYAGPVDGAPVTGGDCGRRALRGGPWSGNPGNLRSADRLRNPVASRIDTIGFRVARTL